MKQNFSIIFILLLSCVSVFADQKTKSESGSNTNTIKRHQITHQKQNLNSFPNEIKQVIKNIKNNRTTYFQKKREKLKKVENPYKFRKSMTNNFLFYKIAPLTGSCDMFNFEICFNTVTKKYWILKTGGFAGVYDLYEFGKIK